ncbi:TrkH family potassium uptake protein [Ghiorsea bivora]|uniref:TrkH family potassium uptake protein n=1 Tax=Ghiorsea bivora TaxID=1485545 RepID=UPI000AA5E8B9|nr:TrkH family potassium uptake protein [Ghiorsea bivora]
MHLKGIVWTLGVLVCLFAGGMMFPALVALYYDSGHADQFILAGVLVLILGISMVSWAGEAPKQLGHKDGFLIVALAWVVLSVLGAIPFLTTGTCKTVVDALFESTSGLTTTGATVLTGLDNMPHAILFWRSMQQWLGGMGIIVLAVAVMPLLGVGGMQLFKAETPGPVKDKLTARVTETAKVLWLLYLATTVMATIALKLAGMGWFDALNHAMTSVSTGGFSTHDASVGHFSSLWIRGVIVVTMILGAVNFTLHFMALRNGFTLRTYLEDDELMTYFKWLASIILIVGVLTVSSGKGEWNEVVFNIVSISTSAGFAVSDYGLWPPATSLFFLIVMFVGGCSGSTAGGMKVVRILLLFRQGIREVRRLIHPHAVLHVKVGNKSVEGSVVQALWGFFALYIVCFIVIAVLVAMTGVDILTAISASAATITNAGPGFGDVGPASTYAMLPDTAKAVLMFGMVLGRLEIFTFFVLLVPEFWRK